MQGYEATLTHCQPTQLGMQLAHLGTINSAACTTLQLTGGGFAACWLRPSIQAAQPQGVAPPMAACMPYQLRLMLCMPVAAPGSTLPMLAALLAAAGAASTRMIANALLLSVPYLPRAPPQPLDGPTFTAN
jgi:hypothetical protein